jgi:hypothetical protein
MASVQKVSRISENNVTSTTAQKIINYHRLHDVFNLATLPLICGANILYLILGFDNLLEMQFYLFTLYLLSDTIWVLILPQSVASPSTITQHHLVVLLGWVIPHYTDPSLSRWCSLGLLVEINTFFLIGRRFFKRTVIMQIFFYATWIILRMIIFPIILYSFIIEYIEVTEKNPQGPWLNTRFFVLFVMMFLNILNFSWTWDLIFKKNKVKRADNAIEGL